MSDLFKAKSDQEIETIISNMSVDELLTVGSQTGNMDMVKLGIEKADTNVWAFDFDPTHYNESNPINLKSFYEVEGIEERYVLVKRIFDEGQSHDGEYSLKFFGSRFTPIYKDDPFLKEIKKIINDIYKAF